jgi:holo-[acyl-carrier protein] synthase
MPIRPYSLGFNIGVDICRIERVVSLISIKEGDALSVDRNKFDRFTRRIFSPLEKILFLTRLSQRTRQDVTAMASTLAGGWAAKEAIFKACNRRVMFPNIFILRGHGNKPLYAAVLDEGTAPPSLGDLKATELDSEDLKATPLLKAKNFQEHLDKLSGQEVDVSITHDGGYAVAVALVPKLESSDLAVGIRRL